MCKMAASRIYEGFELLCMLLALSRTHLRCLPNAYSDGRLSNMIKAARLVGLNGRVTNYISEWVNDYFLLVRTVIIRCLLVSPFYSLMSFTIETFQEPGCTLIAFSSVCLPLQTTRVIFCVFLETDFTIYKKKMAVIFQGMCLCV